LVRKGIVAQSTIRFAASASVIAASLLVAGPNPAQAVADKHGSGSHNQYDGSKGGFNSRGGIGPSGVSTWVSGVLGGGDNQTSSIDSPLQLGADNTDVGDFAVTQSVAPDGPVALRSAAVAEPPAGVNASGAAVAAPRGGSAYSTPFARALRSPRVVFGNGRTPGEHVPGSWQAPETLSDRLQAADAPEAVPAAPEAAEIDLPALPPPSPPTQHIRAAVVMGELGIGTIDTTTDPLAGVAGLILIPAVGAVLGYRQARAAQSVRESASTSASTSART
jgi:hypothetical protein